MKYILPIFTLLLFSFVASSSVFAYSFNPPDEKTGAPNEGNCTQCHIGNTLNSTSGSLMLTVPDTYSPGIEYDIIVSLARNGQKRWGFQMTALNNNGSRVGTFATADGNTQLTQANSKQYIQHTTSGTAQGTNNSNEWMFKWTAPTTNVGPISFYAAGNAANNDFGTSGDYIYTEKATSESIVYGVELTGVGSLTKTTTDASDGISYTLQVKNSGNTSDTISLSTSSESASLSSNSVTLDPGASRNITLTVPGTALTAAGDYDVTVKAISQGDSTKTDEITTTTTVQPVYGVSLTGIENLTKELTNAGTGVVYRLRVTNNGNTSDTIRLSTSGDVSGTLSPTTVFLAPGASRNITLTVSGTALKTAGDYDVKVSAVSRGDSTKTAEVSTTTTVLPVYGVTLTGIGNLTQELANVGTEVSYSFRIRNNGNTSDTFRLSTSGDASATLSRTSLRLGSGSSFIVRLTIPAASLTTAGDYDLTVKAVSQGDSTKTAEITTTTTVLPVYGVTLTGIGNLTKELTNAGFGVIYSLRVTNNGNTTDTISLSTSGDVSETVSPTLVSLDSGASTQVTLSIPGTSLTTAGDYNVTVSASSRGDSTKIAEVSTTTTILPVYGVTLAGVGELTIETPDASDDVSYKFTVTNTGNTDDMIDISMSGDATSTLSEASVSLMSGASAEVTLTISAAELTTAGDYDVTVKATSQGDTTKTAEVSTTTTILPVYGVTLAGVGALTTETSDASNGVSYTLTVTNSGNTNDMIDLSTSDVVSATLSETSVTLASGTSAEVTLTISAAELTTAGDYDVTVSATSQGDNTQTAEVSTTTTIVPVYGVRISRIEQLTETPELDEEVIYRLTVTNTGNTDDTIHISSSDDTTVTLSQTSVPLAAGASAEVIITVSTASLPTAGDYGIIVYATSQGDNTQTVEISTTTTILPVYGVMIAGVGELTTETSDASDGISYTFTVTNTGNTDDVIDLSTSDDVSSLSQTSVPLAFGASAEVTLTIPSASLTIAGDYEVIVTATSQGDNTQTAEVSTTTTILPVYGVTLAGVGALTTETSDAGDGISYKFTVMNTGNTEDIIDLSTSGGATGTLSQTSVTLASGTSAEVTLTISAAELTTAGDYEIIVTATSQGDTGQTTQTTISTTIDPVYGIMFQVDGGLQGSTSDILAGVSYTLTVTNTGNIKDTIVVGSSAEVGIEGSVLGVFTTSSDQEIPTSQVEIMLEPGASETVIFTAAGDFFTKPGVFDIIVKATSQGDNSKSIELTTTTTIDPVVWDVNADGAVNILDLVQVANQFGESGEGLAGDVNMDGEVNILDLVQVANYFGKTQVEIIQLNQ